MTWTELRAGCGVESVRERQTPYEFTHTLNLRNKTRGQRKKQRTENKLEVTTGEASGGWREQGTGRKGTLVLMSAG